MNTDRVERIARESRFEGRALRALDRMDRPADVVWAGCRSRWPAVVRAAAQRVGESEQAKIAAATRHVDVACDIVGGIDPVTALAELAQPRVSPTVQQVAVVRLDAPGADQVIHQTDHFWGWGTKLSRPALLVLADKTTDREWAQECYRLLALDGGRVTGAEETGRAALERLTDPAGLTQVARTYVEATLYPGRTDWEATFGRLVLARLDEVRGEAGWVDLALKLAADGQDGEPALARITDQDRLMTVWTKARSDRVRVAAAERLTDRSTLIPALTGIAQSEDSELYKYGTSAENATDPAAIEVATRLRAARLVGPDLAREVATDIMTRRYTYTTPDIREQALDSIADPEAILSLAERGPMWTGFDRILARLDEDTLADLANRTEGDRARDIVKHLAGRRLADREARLLSIAEGAGSDAARQTACAALGHIRDRECACTRCHGKKLHSFSGPPQCRVCDYCGETRRTWNEPCPSCAGTGRGTLMDNSGNVIGCEDCLGSGHQTRSSVTRPQRP